MVQRFHQHLVHFYLLLRLVVRGSDVVQTDEYSSLWFWSARLYKILRSHLPVVLPVKVGRNHGYRDGHKLRVVVDIVPERGSIDDGNFKRYIAVGNLNVDRKD